MPYSDQMPEKVAVALKLILEDGWRYKGAARYTGTTVQELHFWMRVLIRENKGKYAQNIPLDVGELGWYTRAISQPGRMPDASPNFRSYSTRLLCYGTVYSQYPKAPN